MERAEVVLEMGQESLSRRKWESGDVKMAGRKVVRCGAGMDSEMDEATPDRLVLPPGSLVLRNSPKPVNQGE